MDLISELNETDTQSEADVSQNTSSFLSEKLAAKSYMSSFSMPRPSLKIQKVHSQAIKLARNSNLSNVEDNTEEDVHDTDLKDNLLVMKEIAPPAEDVIEKTFVIDENETTINEVADLGVMDEFEMSQMFIDEKLEGSKTEESSLTTDNINENDAETETAANSSKINEEVMLENLENGWETMLESYASTTETAKDSSDKSDVNECNEDKDVSRRSEDCYKFLFIFFLEILILLVGCLRE